MLLGALVTLAMMIALGINLNFVSIRYPRIIENQTLSAPVRVSSVDRDLMQLEDGRKIRLDQGPLDDPWDRLLGRPGCSVEIETVEEIGTVVIWSNEPRTVCGGTAAIKLRLIPHDVNRNRRSLVAFGTVTENGPNAEQGGRRDANHPTN